MVGYPPELHALVYPALVVPALWINFVYLLSRGIAEYSRHRLLSWPWNTQTILLTLQLYFFATSSSYYIQLSLMLLALYPIFKVSSTIFKETASWVNF